LEEECGTYGQVLVVLFDINDINFDHIFTSGSSGNEADIFLCLLNVLKQLDQLLGTNFDGSAAALLFVVGAIGELPVGWLIDDQLVVWGQSFTGTKHFSKNFRFLTETLGTGTYSFATSFGLKVIVSDSTLSDLKKQKD
jgi:hypothetical protein